MLFGKELMDFHFNTYYTYDQLTERLAWLAGQHPRIMQATVFRNEPGV